MAGANKKQSILILVVVLVLFVGMGVGIVLSALNDKIPPNPAGTVGNTAGNIYNGGLYCESDGMVYFSNAYDGGALYSMTIDERELKRLNATVSRNILAGGDYLYYFQTGTANRGGFGYLRSPSSFNRCLKNGKKIHTMARSIIVSGQLVGDDLILLDNNENSPRVIKLKTDKSEEKVLANFQFTPACAVGNTVYYNGTQSNHHLFALNTASDSSSEIWDYNLWYPIVDGEYVYFLDIENGYHLCRYSMVSGNLETLTDDRVECYNLGGGYLYYQTGGNDPKLMCMYLDGSGKNVVSPGVYTNINMTSRFVYVQSFFDSETVYHSPLGGNALEPFTNAYILSLDDK